MVLEEIKNIQSTKKDLRKFGLTVGGVFLILGMILFLTQRPFSLYGIGCGLVLLLPALVAPAILQPLQKAWMALAIVLGWFMTRVILSVLFFIIITPMSVISRVLGKQFLDLKWDRARHSYWNYRQPGVFLKSDYEKQF